MAHAVKFTEKSGNSKVGPMPVSTTSADTCPDACPLKAHGCYAEAGPLGMLWKALSAAVPGQAYRQGRGTSQSLTWSGFVARIAALPIGTLWRHNQAGDLPGTNDAIDAEALSALVAANVGKRGFTYTHKPLTGPHGAANKRAIASANARGFVVNLSADNLREADELVDENIAPVVVILSAEVHGNAKIETPKGRKVSVCPATYLDNVSCATCQLCQRSTRASIVGFPAHGTSKRKASTVATGA